MNKFGWIKVFRSFLLVGDYQEGMRNLVDDTKLKPRFTSAYAKIISVLLGIYLMGVYSQATATASLAAEDKIDEIVVTVKGVKESFTVIRDAQIKEQWYYIPDRPRIFERTVNGKAEPDFSLIRYQFKDPDNAQQLLEGGLLQFAASLAIPSDAKAQLEAAIMAKVGDGKPVRLASMPFNEANVNIYTPVSGKLIAAGTQGAGIAPVHATQKMVFSIPMTRIGSDVYDELINGNTGIPVVIDYSFNGLTPPAGFNIIVDWAQTYKYYSKNQKFAAAASYYGLVGGATNIDKEKIAETLVREKCISIDIIEGANFTYKDIAEYLEPILTRINNELIKTFAPPKEVKPAATRGASASGKYFSASYSSSLKDISQVKKERETVVLKVRQHQVRKSIVSGFIGIGRYSDEIKNKLVTEVPEGPWQSAYFVLPAVGDAKELGINQVDLEIGLADNNQIRQSQVVVWTPEGGWRDRDGKLRTVLSFAIMGLKASGFDLKNAEFVSKAQITLKREIMKIDQKRPVFDGETAISTPLEAVDVVVVDGTQLSWNKIDQSSSLGAINVKLQSGDRNFSGRLKPRRVNGEWVEPLPLFWLLEKNKGPVTAKIKYLYNDGRKVDWVDNGKDLLNDLSSLEITLFDQELQ